MATDLEQLVLSISADNRQMLRVLKKMEGDVGSSTRNVERRFDDMARKIDARLGGIGKNAFAGVFAGLTAAVSVNELLRLADVWTELTGRVDLAAGSTEKSTEVMGRLGEMARRTYSSLEQTAESYLANAKTLTELGYSTQTQLDYTEALNNALVISAAKGDRARSVMDALSKAMALGKLTGDNLNTVISTGGRVAQALADSMGVTTLELRKLGADGKITRKELIGITSETEKLREEADGMAATLSDAFVLMRNAALQYVGAGDQAIGVSRQLADAVILVADNFDTVADAGVRLGFVIASALVGRAIGGMLMTIPTAVAAIGTLIAAMKAGTLTAFTFSAALGPIGIAAGGLAAALYLLHTSQTDAELAAEAHEAALKELKYRIETVDYANGEAVASTRQKIAADIDAARVSIARAKAERDLAAAIATQRLETAKGRNARSIVTRERGAEKEHAETIAAIEKQIEDLLAVQSEFEDYASGRKAPPTRDVDRPIDVDSGDSKRKSKGKDDEYERLTAQIEKRTAALLAETEAQRGINPLIDDYGFAIERARAAQDLLTAAKEAGLAVGKELKDVQALLNGEFDELSPKAREQAEAMLKLASGYAQASAEAEKLGKSQDEIRRKAEEMQEFQKDLTRGIVDGFMQGKKAADILADSLSKLGNKLLDLAFNAAFDSPSKGGASFNPLGFLAGMFRERGGPVKKGQPYIVGEKRPELFVPDQDGKILPSVPQVPRMPDISTPRSAGDVRMTYAPVLNFTGTAAELAEFRRQAAEDRATFEARTVAAVRNAQKGRHL